MNIRVFKLAWRNFLFWVSRKINYPLVAADTTQINFTFQCNLKCKMCHMFKHMAVLKEKGERTEIDSQTIRKIIRESHELKIKNIILIGGEPFLRNDLFDLINYAKTLGLTVTIITNGVMLKEEIIKRCFEHKVDCLAVSIDAARDNTFLKIRSENVLKPIIQNIKNLIELREENNFNFPRISAICTIMDDNLEELLEVANLCKELKIDNISFQPAVANNVAQSDRNTSLEVSVPSSRFNLLDEAINSLISYKNDNPDFILNGIRQLEAMKKYFRRELSLKDAWACYAGFNRIQITQDYVVYFCVPPNENFKSSFGDVSKNSLKELWYSKDAKIRRKLIKKCNQPCLQGCSSRLEFLELSELTKKFF